MTTTVIIPAFNEERHIESVLGSLPRKGVRPIVAVNGSTDRTAELARTTGAEVFDLPEQGKLPAVQHVLRTMGQEALEPLLILDADTRPMFPPLWLAGITRELALNEGRPTLVGGPVVFRGSNVLSDTIRTVRRTKRAIQARSAGSNALYLTDPNMGLKIQTRETLEAILGLPHYWPGEGFAIAKTIVNNGGSVSQVINPMFATLVPVSPSQLGIIESTKLGYEESRRITRQRYVDRGAEGSEPFNSNLML